MSGLRGFVAAALLIGMMHGAASAQIMRFETSVGSFDMELNPTNDPNLQPLVDNIVAYIGLGRFHHTAINRAVEGNPGTADDFVLQMGGFLAFPTTPGNWLNFVTPIEKLNEVVTDGNGDGQVDFTALSNTRGTVSLALSGPPNTGTSSFFINLNDTNSFLDQSGFVPFARVSDLTTIEKIMALDQVNLTNDPNNPTFTDVPILENGRLVVLKSVHLVQSAPSFSFTGPIAAALAQQAADDAAEMAFASSLAEETQASIAAIDEIGETLIGDASGSASLNFTAAPGAPVAVPEPAAATLAGLAVLAAARRRRR